MGNELEPKISTAPILGIGENRASLPQSKVLGGFDFSLASFQMAALGRLSGKEVVVEERDSMAVITEIRDLPPDEGVIIEGTAVEVFPGEQTASAE